MVQDIASAADLDADLLRQVAEHAPPEEDLVRVERVKRRSQP